MTDPIHPASVDLLPCPFCGSSDLWTDFSHHDGSIDCRNCGASLPIPTKSPETQAAAWNTRPEIIQAPASPPLPANPPATAAGVGEAVVLYVPMPVTKDGCGPADESDTDRVEHQIWDAETNGTLATATDEAVARHIVSLWNTTTASHDALIAAAPDLLTALKRITELVTAATISGDRKVAADDWSVAQAENGAYEAIARALLNDLDARDGG